MARILISVSQKLAVLEAKEKWGAVGVNLPLTELTREQRETLSDYPASEAFKRDTGADFDLTDPGKFLSYPYNSNDWWKDTPKFAEANADAVKTLLDFVGNKKQQIADHAAKYKAESEAKARADRDKKVADLLAVGVRGIRVGEDSYQPYTHVYNGSEWKISTGLGKVTDDPRLAELMQAAQAECDRLNAEAKAEREKSAAEKKAKQEAGETALREWANANGSDLLRARMADGFEWTGLAEREFAAQQVSGLGDKVDPPSEDFAEGTRTTPTLEEIQKLRDVRAKLDGALAKAELVWCVYQDCDGDEGTVKQAEVHVTVTCPTGREVEFYFPAV